MTSSLPCAFTPKPMLSKPSNQFQLPDWVSMTIRNSNAKGVTKHLLWEEYSQAYPNRSYSYAQYCFLYGQWRKKQKRSMRQIHKAGEKLFVDYAGQTVPIVCSEIGEIRTAQIFVAVLGASNYIFCEATWSQKLPDWLGSHARAFTFFGGVPKLIVPDNLKSAVTKACRYDPEINRNYTQLGEHYGTAIMPARPPLKPQDKSKAEVGVQITERWVLARLRHHTFFSLAEVNHCIKALMVRIRISRIRRKNWMFSNTTKGAQVTSAILYSVIETAKANGLIPFDYLMYLFEQLPNKPEGIDYLLPWNMT